MKNISIKYLTLGLSLAFIVTATLFYLQKEQISPVKQVLTTKASAIDYAGALPISANDITTAATPNLTDMAAAVTAEALKAFSDSTDRGLPLMAHWDVNEADAMNPTYMLTRLEKGEHVLVSWKLDPYYLNTIGNAYYEESIKKAAELNLPLVFILPAPESALTKDSYYKTLAKNENPNVVDIDGNILDTLSPFGPNNLWSEIGEQWTSTSLMTQIQEWYPNPPLVVFINENRASKLSWNELDTSSRYVNNYPSDKNDEYKRALIGAQWIEKYRQMHTGFKQGLTKEDWKNNVKFVSYNDFSDDLEEMSTWLNNSTLTNQYLDISPFTVDGTTVNFDLTKDVSYTSIDAPQIAINNLPFMLQEAKRDNPSFMQQLSITHNSNMTDPTLYRGLTQFGLWFLRPNIIRQDSPDSTLEEMESLFNEMSDSVELIHNSDILSDFWKNGELVSNGESNFNSNIPEQYQDDPRWFLLDVDANPSRPWSDSSNIKVWAFALVKGEVPNREWLVYLQSNDGNLTDISVKLADYTDISLSSNTMGTFYTLNESNNNISKNIVNTDTDATVETVSAVILPASIEYGNGTTYYFDATNGNDSYSGTTEQVPFKTIEKFQNLQLQAGDNVLFKRGEIWEGSRLINFYYPSGTETAPILYSSYGDQNKPRPIITSIQKHDLSWTKSASTNIWYTEELKNNPRRLFKNGTEILNARWEEEISSGQPWFYTYETDRLYLYTTSDPNNDSFEFSYAITCYLEDQSYIIIDGLDIQGGTSVQLKGSSNIHIVNSKIGLNSSYGLTVTNTTNNNYSKNIRVEHSIFDSGFTLDYTWIESGGSGADYIGSNDGITFGAGVETSTVYNNYFKNWNHASLAMETSSEYGIHHNEIAYNTMTAPDVAYGGRIALSGNAYKNELHHNLIKDINVVNQIRGFENYFHHNVIDGVNNSHIKDANIGQCISLTSSSGPVYDNIFELNTLRNCDGAGIYINSYDTDSAQTIYNNTFKDNMIENCDIDGNTLPKETDIMLTRGAGYQKFENNYISSDTVNYQRELISIPIFNEEVMGSNTNSLAEIGISIGAGDESLLGSIIIY